MVFSGKLGTKGCLAAGPVKSLDRPQSCLQSTGWVPWGWRAEPHWSIYFFFFFNPHHTHPATFWSFTLWGQGAETGLHSIPGFATSSWQWDYCLSLPSVRITGVLPRLGTSHQACVCVFVCMYTCAHTRARARAHTHRAFLCSPAWPQTRLSSCLSLPSVRIYR